MLVCPQAPPQLLRLSDEESESDEDEGDDEPGGMLALPPQIMGTQVIAIPRVPKSAC